jgi:PqqD family protein of HPr-rel-A system
LRHVVRQPARPPRVSPARPPPPALTDGVSPPGIVSLPTPPGDHPGVDGAVQEWRLPAGVSLLWQTWDENEIIIFNRASGQTHLLDAFSAAALRRIEAAPTTIPDLQRTFASELALKESVLGDRLSDVCQHFDQLGLAEPFPS